MNFEIRFTPEAKETYYSVIEQLRQRWGDNFVKKFENTVVKSVNTIAISPFLYPVLNEKTGMRRCVLHKNCSMFYSIYENCIMIGYFWDNRQEPLWI